MSLKDFVPMGKVGEGSFGTVYKVRRLTDQKIYAMKKVNIARLDLKSKNNALNQVRILASLESPNIISYHQAFFEDKLDLLCIVMQFADGGDLSSIIKRAIMDKRPIPEIQIWKILINILHGIKDLHDRSILHRDLKNQNLFIFGNEQKIKIGDLNVSKVRKNQIEMTQTGTPYYASPQVWEDRPYDQKSDIWSIGCILYELAALRPPFEGNDMTILYQNVKSGRYKKIPPFYSNQLGSIIGACLRVNSVQRPKASDLLENFTVKMYKNICIPHVSEKVSEKAFLKTITMPKNKKDLKQKLPKSNYKDERQEFSTDSVPIMDKPQQISRQAHFPESNQREVKTEIKKTEGRQDISDKQFVTQFTPESIKLNKEESGQDTKRKIRSLPRTQGSLQKLRDVANIQRRVDFCNNKVELNKLIQRRIGLKGKQKSSPIINKQKDKSGKKQNKQTAKKIIEAKLSSKQHSLKVKHDKIADYVACVQQTSQKLQKNLVRRRGMIDALFY